MSKAVVIPVDPTDACTMAEVTDLASMQTLVGGRIECVVLSDGSDMWINDDGKFNGSVLNVRATILASDVLFQGDHIFGDAFITGPTDDEGEHTDVKADVVRKLGLAHE